MRSLRSVAVAVLFCLLGAPRVHADQVDDLILSEMKRQNIPGVALAIVQDGKVIKAAGYGLADIRQETKVTADTIFKIGSVSKQFIATAVMLLVQDGQLHLDDPVSRHLEGTPDAWSGITIRHLLTHTSGLVRESPGFDPFSTQPDSDVIRAAFALPLRLAPGEKWEYSNVGYYVLAEVIHQVTAEPWNQYIAERVFQPSGMRATRTTTTDPVPGRATGYTDNDSPRPAEDWPAVRPSGGFLSTVLDLAKWDAVLYTDSVLTEESRRLMTTPVTLNDGSTYPYGFGWHLGTIDGHRAVFHGGGLPGFIAQLVRYPDVRLTIAILMNTDDADDQVLATGVARSYLTQATAR